MVQDGRHPRRDADLVGEHREEFVVRLGVVFKDLLRKGLASVKFPVQSDLDRGAGGGGGGGGWDGEVRLVSGPDGEERCGGLAAIADGDGCGVDEEVEFASSEEGDPVEPLHARREAGGIDGARGEAVWREGETAPTGPTGGVVWDPCGSVKRGEVGFEHELELDDGGGWVRRQDEGSGEECDGMGESDVKAASRDGHDVAEMRDCTEIRIECRTNGREARACVGVKMNRVDQR